MKELISCCYELMLLELRAQHTENLFTLLHMAERIDLLCKGGIIEERNDGHTAKRKENGQFDGSEPYADKDGEGSSGSSSKESSEKKKNIEDAFRKGLKDKSSKETVNTIIDNHEALAAFTPDSMKSFLEECGYEVRPLGRKSSLKGRSLDDGGGYRVTFGGDGYFQYHPKEGSHHGDAYWKIGNGERGLHRYEMDGRIKNK